MCLEGYNYDVIYINSLILSANEETGWENSAPFCHWRTRAEKPGTAEGAGTKSSLSW